MNSLLLKVKQGINKKIMMPIRIKSKIKNCDIPEISILSVNCIGGVLYHDYGMRFLSPTVNLSFSAEDYIKFMENLDYYLSQSLVPISNEKYHYPLMKLDDITIEFVHYKDYAECIEKWESRKKRIRYDQILAIFTDQRDCTPELIERFSQLPYKKLMFSGTNVTGYDFIVDVNKGFMKGKKYNPVDTICFFRGLTGKRNYEYFFDFKQYLSSESSTKPCKAKQDV